MGIEKTSEKGQIVLLLMLVLVVLLAFLALAIDGGMVFSDRRYVQGVADSVSLAAAGIITNEINPKNPDGSSLITYENFSCSNSRVKSAVSMAVNEAHLRASANNISLDSNISDGHGIEVVCVDGSNGNGHDKHLDVIVKIISETDTAFAHLVLGSPLKVRVESVVRVIPASTGEIGNMVVPFNPSDNAHSNRPEDA